MSKMYRVEPVKEDIEYILDNLRDEDRIEMEADRGSNWREEVLKRTLELEDVTMVHYEDKPIIMYGVIPQELPAACVGGSLNKDRSIEYAGAVWLLATKEIIKNQVQFFRECRKELKRWDKEYKWLYNYVHNGNSQAIKWLKWLGFKFDCPRPLGHWRRNFQYFYKICEVK